MGKVTGISWCDHTFNCWSGCAKVSPACANCYAAGTAKRNPSRLGVWGDAGTRVVGGDAYWRQPALWNKSAEKAGERRRVFCASMADVFEDWTGPMLDAQSRRFWVDRTCAHKSDAPWWLPETPQGSFAAMRLLTMDDVRRRLFSLIDATPNIDWLLLTKRPESIENMTPEYSPRRMCSAGNRDIVRRNVWSGTTVEDGEQDRLARVVRLLDTPASIRFLSVEPMLSALDLTRIPLNGGYRLDALRGRSCGTITRDIIPCARIDWVIIGCESGPKRRPTDLAWVRDLVAQCRAAGTAVFVKQLEVDGTVTGDVERFPDDLRIREFPKAVAA